MNQAATANSRIELQLQAHWFTLALMEDFIVAVLAAVRVLQVWLVSRSFAHSQTNCSLYGIALHFIEDSRPFQAN